MFLDTLNPPSEQFYIRCQFYAPLNWIIITQKNRKVHIHISYFHKQLAVGTADKYTYIKYDILFSQPVNDSFG